MLGEKLFAESSLRIGYIICFVTAVGFVCSLTYNYGYFWNFDAGIRILSIADILTSYALWIPTLGTLFFVYGLDVFLTRVEIAKTEKRIIKKSQFPGLVKFLIGLPQAILLIAVVVLLIYYLTFGEPYKPLILCLGMVILWVKILGSLLTSKAIKGRTNKYILGIFIFIPATLSLMFALGLDESQHESKLTTPNAVIYFIDKPFQQFPTILLRHLEKGLLAKQIKQNDYMLFTWDDISRIEIISQNKQFNGIACEWFNLRCDKH
jgi:hypothetical protein